MRGQTVAVAASTPSTSTAPAATAAPATSPTAAKVAQMGLGNPSLPAQIYGKKSCPWTGRAMTVLEKRNVDYDFIDLEEPEHEKYTPVLSTETHQHTVPYVYLRGQFVGGFNALAEIERLGQLEYALMSTEQRAAAPAHLRMIEIAARPNTDEVAPAELEGPPVAE
jgi:glutaredoxin